MRMTDRLIMAMVSEPKPVEPPIANASNGTVSVLKQVKQYSASGHVERVETKPIPISEVLERNGLGRDNILRKLARQLDANDVVLAQWSGEFTDIAEVPSNPSRNKAIELACKLHGLIDGKPDVNVGVSISINWDSAMPAWTKPPIDVPSASSGASVGVDSVAVDSVASADATPTPILSQIEGTGNGPRRMNSHPLGQSSESQTPSTLSERVEKPRLRSGPRLPVNGKKYGARGRRG